MSIEAFFNMNLTILRFSTMWCYTDNMVKKDKNIQLSVKGISLHHETQMPFIILQSIDNKYTLPISIGPFEASAIITKLENIHTPRPLTHDLFSDMLLKHKFKLKSLHIYNAIEDKYYAKIFYSHGLKKFSTELRPSDGIALIIRHGGSISIKKEILEQKENQNWIYEIDQQAEDFLFLKNNSSELTFM